MKWSLLLLISLYAIPINSLANCSSVNLSDRFKSIENQGEVAWCYAYMLSDLFNHELQLESSAPDIAISYNNFYKPGAVGFFDKVLGSSMMTVKDGGRPEDAFEAIKKAGGLCPDSIIKSTPDTYGLNSNDGNIMDVLKFIQMDIIDFKNNKCQNFFDFYYRKIFKNTTNLSGLIKLLPTLQNDFTSEDWFNITQLNCKDKRIPIDQNIKFNISSTIGKNRKTINAVMEELDQKLENKKPVGASISTTQIKDVKFYQYPLHLLEKAFDAASRASFNFVLGTHAVTVIGREFNKTTNKCEYIVRTSGGYKCDGVKKDKCKGGVFTMDREELQSSLETIYTIQKP